MTTVLWIVSLCWEDRGRENGAEEVRQNPALLNVLAIINVPLLSFDMATAIVA